MTKPPICSSQCSTGKMWVLHFHWICSHMPHLRCPCENNCTYPNKGIALMEYSIELMDNLWVFHLASVPLNAKKMWVLQI